MFLGFVATRLGGLTRPLLRDAVILLFHPRSLETPLGGTGGGGYVYQNQKSTAYTGQSTSAKLKAHEYALSRRNPDHLKPESTDFKNFTLRTESTRKYRI